MRKLMILAMMLAMVLVAAMPALAQSGGGTQSDQYGGGMAPVYCGEIDQPTAQQRLDEDPQTWALLDADGDGVACNEEHVPELACEDFATQEEAQKFLGDHPSDPYNIDPDGNGVACDSKKGSTSQDGEVRLAFEVVTEGECSADTTFFATMGAPQSEGFSRQLTDPDGDGVYTFSQGFDRGQELINIEVIKGTGTKDWLFGPLPQGQDKLVESFGTMTLDEDATLSATASCDGEGTGTKNPEGEEATLNYELAVEGQCPADATFFGENNLVGAADYVGTVQLTDPDGDGVYTHSEKFPAGSEFDGLSIVRGTGINENFNSSFFQGPVPGEPITAIKSFDAITLEEDTTLSASVSCDDTVEPKQEEATLNFELTVAGQCPADTNFFAGMNTSHGYSVPLADPDGDSIYSGSIAFGKGTDLLEVGLYKGAGIHEGPYGQIPVGEPVTIQTFGNLTVEKDEKFSATTSCDETPVNPVKKSKPDPAATKNIQGGSTQSGSIQGSSGSEAGKNAPTGIIEGVRGGLEKLPDTGGMSLMLLGSGVLLIGGGLVIRRMLR